MLNDRHGDIYVKQRRHVAVSRNCESTGLHNIINLDSNEVEEVKEMCHRGKKITWEERVKAPFLKGNFLLNSVNLFKIY